MITAHSLTKRYGPATAVDDLTFEAQSGLVTGFLGPNGSGKSTTMRMIMGLDKPTSGSALISGKPYSELGWPLREVGALLDAKAFHPARSARNHLRSLALTNDISLGRVDEVLDQVGLSSVAGRRAGKFSLGMGQRLGIAAALLGDPGVLLLDEPANGLDPEGIRWIRQFLRGLAAEGRTVFVSSHLISETSLTADRLVVIGRGRLIAESSVADFVARSGGGAVKLVTPDRVAFALALAAAGAQVRAGDGGALHVEGLTAPEVADLAARDGLRVHELTPVTASLEDVFMELTHDDVEYRQHTERKTSR
jgi:ABC-2 type transport system ATP-binding protein